MRTEVKHDVMWSENAMPFGFGQTFVWKRCSSIGAVTYEEFLNYPLQKTTDSKHITDSTMVSI